MTTTVQPSIGTWSTGPEGFRRASFGDEYQACYRMRPCPQVWLNHKRVVVFHRRATASDESAVKCEAIELAQSVLQSRLRKLEDSLVALDRIEEMLP